MAVLRSAIEDEFCSDFDDDFDFETHLEKPKGKCSDRLPRCHTQRVSRRRRVVLNSAPDSQLGQVRRQQEPAGVSTRPQARLRC